MSGESKMELRGHDHVVEVITWAPISAYTAIRELAGLPVGVDYCRSADFSVTDVLLEYRSLETARTIPG